MKVRGMGKPPNAVKSPDVQKLFQLKIDLVSGRQTDRYLFEPKLILDSLYVIDYYVPSFQSCKYNTIKAIG